ncbi:MAG: hypothetical protein V4577_22755 [Bacteroidota bacterium]
MKTYIDVKIIESNGFGHLHQAENNAVMDKVYRITHSANGAYINIRKKAIE